MFNSIEGLKSRKARALSVFHDARADLANVITDLHKAIESEEAKIQKLTAKIELHKANIVTARDEVDSAVITIDKIHTIIS